MTDTKIDIRSLSPEELKETVVSLGEKPFRSRQIFGWLHDKKVRDFSEMTNVPTLLKNRLAERYMLAPLEISGIRKSSRDETTKYLFRLPDGEYAESVYMHYEHGDSVCVSSQVGCRMACTFCASTKAGLVRNLTPAEMLDQVYSISIDKGLRISHVVIMGMGEPLENYENVLKFIQLATCNEGMNISQRHITLSTCGIVPGIRRLAQERLQITLAVSLHCAIDSGRSTIMPVNRIYPLEELVAAARYYFETTGRRITLEYALLHGVNDREEDLRALAATALDIKAHVNLIPVNPVADKPCGKPVYVPPDREHIRMFQNKLEKNGINVTIRREMGSDIDGACGQLRRNHIGSE